SWTQWRAGGGERGEATGMPGVRPYDRQAHRRAHARRRAGGGTLRRTRPVPGRLCGGAAVSARAGQLRDALRRVTVVDHGVGYRIDLAADGGPGDAGDTP